MTTIEKTVKGCLTVGQFAEVTKIITMDEVVAFVDATGDYNPLHTNSVFAAMTPFKVPIVPGALLGSFIATLIAMKLPGSGSVARRLNLKFVGAMAVGALVRVRVQVKALKGPLAKLDCACMLDEEHKYVEGEAMVMVNRN